MYLLKKILVISSLTSIISFAEAQDKLSISTAIKLGLSNNYDIRIQKEVLKKATNNNNWGQAGRMPKIDLNTTFNNSINNINNDPQLNFGFVSPGFTLKKSISNSLAPTINIGWTLFSGNKVLINKKQLENLQRESSGNAEIVVSNTIQTIILSYYSVILESERLRYFKQQLDLSKDKYEYWKLKSEVGGAIKSEVLLEEGNYLADSSNYLNQQLAYRSSLRQFNFILAEKNLDKTYEFVSQLGENWKKLTFETLNNSIQNNVNLKYIYINQAILRNSIGIRKADRWPILSLNGGYQYNLNRQDLTKAISNLTDENGQIFKQPTSASISRAGTAYINFTLAFTLFNGGKINRAIQNAVTDFEVGNIQVDKLKASIFRDLSDNFDTYTIREQFYLINQRRKKVAQENLAISTEKYKNGLINSFDFRIVQNNYFTSSIQELESIYALLNTRVALSRLTGGLLNNFID